MNLQPIFLNKFDRLRSGWRFALFLLAFFFCAAFFNLLAAMIFAQLNIEFKTGTLLFIVVNSASSLVLVVVFGWLFGRHLEDLPFRALGLSPTKNWLKDLIFGVILGAFTLSLAVVTGVIFGGLSFQINPDASAGSIVASLIFSFLVFTIAASFEEAFFRGYILQTFARANLAWLAILLTSLFFGVMHLTNPSANGISSLNTVLAGIWFSVAYLKTRTLWLPIGLHLMWNWMQGAIYGIEVSGLKTLVASPLLREIDAGPAWLTGENYGIEGGYACTFVLVFSTALIYFLPFTKPTEEMLALTSEEKRIK